jgi:hypothetical protein
MFVAAYAVSVMCSPLVFTFSLLCDRHICCFDVLVVSVNVKLPSYLDLYWVEYNRTFELKPSVWF